jgi:thymidylate synthase
MSSQPDLKERPVRSIGFIEILIRDGEPQLDNANKYILAKLVDGENASRSVPCLMHKPSWYETEDILHLKCCLAAIPSLIFGRLRSERKLQIYVAITLPDKYRSEQWYYPFHFKQIAQNAKLFLERSFPFTSWPQDKAEACCQILEQIRQTDQLEDFTSVLSLLRSIWSIANVSGPIMTPLDQLGQKGSINGATFLSLVIHVLCRLSLAREVPNMLSRLSFTLGLLRKPKSQILPPLEGPAGNRFCLILKDDLTRRQIVLTDTGEVVREEDVSNDLTHRLGFNLPYRYSPSSSASLQKYIPEGPIDYRGDAMAGNPLSCVAFASVGGRIRPEIKPSEDHASGGVLQPAAALIPLEDRHKRTARLPEPWQSNLRKLMEIIASNPNIRHLIIFGETQFCDHTIDYLLSWKTKSEGEALPPEYFPPELINRFHRQISVETLEVIEGDTITDLGLVWKLKRLVDLSFLDHILDCTTPQICETSCFPPDSWTMEKSKSSESREPLLEGISAIQARDRTVARVYPKVVDSVRCYGRTKVTKDEMGRCYRELLSFRIIVEDPTSEQTSFGFMEEELVTNFKEQWLGEAYREEEERSAPFYERMHLTFGTDQVANTVNRIVNCIRDAKVSRSILINVHHPGVDARSVLGLNTIHYTLEHTAPDSQEWLLHASYIWRTVDVLAGLPFNIHAAASFLCYIVNECNKKLKTLTEQPSYLSPGEMMIVALNLHLYEGLDCNIAEQLVRRSLETPK